MGDMIEDSLETPLQSGENGIHIDTRTKKYYPDESDTYTVTPPDGKIIPILYDGVLPYIPVQHTTPE